MRIVQKTDICVKVFPETRGYLTSMKSREQIENLELDAARGIVGQIKRHVDDWTDVIVSFETDVACSFCDYTFHDSEPADNLPGCCNEAIVEFVTEHPDYVPKDEVETLMIRDAKSKQRFY